MAVRQAELGLPDRSEVGVGEPDMSVLDDLPTRGWEIVIPRLRPYALALGVRTLTAAVIATLVVLSPFLQWWALPVTGTAIGTCASRRPLSSPQLG